MLSKRNVKVPAAASDSSFEREHDYQVEIITIVLIFAEVKE